MTLQELLDVYDGEISVTVSQDVGGEITEAITFTNTEAAYITSSLLASTVETFSVSVTGTSIKATASLSVVVAETADDDSSDSSEEEETT